MATLGATPWTLTDHAKLRDPDGKGAKIVEILTQYNEMLEDLYWCEGNLPTGHRTTIRTGLPAATWRRFNEGVQPSKGTTGQVDVSTGMLVSRSQCDKDLAELGGNVQAYREAEAYSHMEGLSQDLASAFIYEDERINVERITGLAPHYASLSAAVAASSENVINAGGSGSDNTSIWLVGTGPNAICGIYPKGSKAGIQHTDLGIQTVTDATGIGAAQFEAYVEKWEAKAGLLVKDWRFGVRICNIDVSNLEAESSAADLIKLMLRAVEHIPASGGVRLNFYANRKVKKMLGVQALVQIRAGGGLTYENIDGRRILTFQSIPIRTVDRILNTEAAVA